MHKTYEEEEDPFDTLARGSITSLSDAASSDEAISPSTISSVGRHSFARSSTSRAPPSTAPAPSRRPFISTHTFPSYHYDPWSAIRASRVLESDHEFTLPPEYAPVDEHARTFRLQAPFIYTTKTSNLPRYQIQQEFNRAGKPCKLNIRRLQPHETRSCSVPALHAARDPRIRYDDDGTLYSMTSFEMHGKTPTALPGSMQISSGKTLWGGQWTRIWHIQHPRRDSTSSSSLSSSSDREVKPQRRSYSYEDKHLLFAVKKGVWEDADGTVVAREEKRWGIGYGDRFLSRRGSGVSGEGKVLEVTDIGAKDRARMDLVVACWVMRIWMSEGIRWEGDLKG